MAKIHLVSETKERLVELMGDRLPWLMVGLGGGIWASFVVSRFERVLEQNIALAFFVPVIVYMSGAVGTQTETLFVRELTKRGVSFSRYVVKELMIGVGMGAILGSLVGGTAWMWLRDTRVALIVGMAMAVNVTWLPWWRCWCRSGCLNTGRTRRWGLDQ